MKVLVTQSNYIPWHGFFAMVASVDCFVILDTVQFTRRDWRSRNRIRIDGQDRWLTVPVAGPRDQPINAVEIADRDWARRHHSTLLAAYGKVMDGRTRAFIDESYEEVTDALLLSEVNERLLTRTMRLLGIDTPILRAEAFPDHSDPSERLAVIAQAAGATEYWTGPAARAYISEKPFQDREIELRYFDFSGVRGLAEDQGSANGGDPYSIVHDLSVFGVERASERSRFMT